MAIRKINRREVAPKKLPSRFFRELVSHKVLKSKGISLRFVELLPLREAGPATPTATGAWKRSSSCKTAPARRGSTARLRKS